MRRFLAVPFERTATRKKVPSVVAERDLQQVRLYDVTVPHEVLPNSETIAEQNQHLITSMSPRARSASVTDHEHHSDRATPFPSTYYGTWSCAVVTAYSRRKLSPNKKRWYTRCPFGDTSIFALYLTARAVNALFYFVPGILVIAPPCPCPPEKVRRFALRWTSAGPQRK
jgi:hypothetical protein